MNMSPYLCDDLAVFLFILQLGRVYWNQSVAVGCRLITILVLAFSGWASARVVGR